MTVYVAQMKEPRSSYPNHSEKGFLSLKEYLQITKKLVKHILGKTNGKIANEILGSDDAISNIATSIMISDWKYEPGEGTSQQTYRYGGALQAIKTYLKRRSNRRYIYSLDFVTHTADETAQSDLYDSIEDESQIEPIDDSLNNDNQDTINELLLGDTLDEREKLCITKHFFDDMTYQAIGNDIGVCRERVRQIIEHGLGKLRDAMNEN